MIAIWLPLPPTNYTTINQHSIVFWPRHKYIFTTGNTRKGNSMRERKTTLRNYDTSADTRELIKSENEILY